MSCPDWRSLAPASADWDEAVAHFDGGCRVCRRDALKVEPTLVFRQLRSVGATGPAAMSQAQEASEVDAVRQAVAAMRTASRVDARTRHTGWKRWAIAAGLAAAALSIPADNAWQRLAARRQEAAAASQPALLRGNVLPAAYAGDTGGPSPEGAGRPGARVYHMDGDGMSVVMIVDESLDV